MAKKRYTNHEMMEEMEAAGLANEEIKETVNTPAEQEVEEPKPKKAKVYRSDLIRLREQPSMESNIVELLNKDTIVEIQMPGVFDNGFSKVRTKEGKDGYILADLLKFIE